MARDKSIKSTSPEFNAIADAVEAREAEAGTNGAPKKGPRTPEEKADRFRTLANKRVPKAIKSIRAISNLSNRYSYEYSEEQAFRIIDTLEREVAALKERFNGRATPVESWSL